jgi:hypothetical protein
VKEPLELVRNFRDLRASSRFEFFLDGVAWSTRYGEPAFRLP